MTTTGSNFKLKGIKRGRTIELAEDLDLPDGAEIEVSLLSSAQTEEDPWLRQEAVFGAWQHDAEIVEIFAEIDRARHAQISEPVNFNRAE
jgi:hypothetical protein